jgi:hypothetical protein
MKARLYRGPGAGKIVSVGDNEQVVIVQNLARNPMDTYKEKGLLKIETVESYYRRTKHTHPDGSVFFEWEKPRGTKSGVQRDKKIRKSNSTYSVFFDPYYINSTTATTNSTTFTLRP